MCDITQSFNIIMMIKEQVISKIINLINEKKNWNSVDLVYSIRKMIEKEIEIKFKYIGGYELLRDGTKTTVCTSLGDVQAFLDSFDIEYDESITDPIELAESVEYEWNEYYNDGGGSSWIEYS